MTQIEQLTAIISRARQEMQGVYKSAHDIDRGIAERLVEKGALLLPCKIGTRIYILVTKRSKITRPEFSFVKESRLTYNNLERVLERFGETVFLAREEAEKELERMKQND